MRLLHTSDWHLGHTLNDWSRVDEHAAFLAWLLDTLVEEEADALLVAGDIFDVANPPASAQQAFYGFLAAARRRCPDLDLVIIGGNHDSAARLDAPHPLLQAFGVHIVGGLPLDEARTLDHARIVTKVRSRHGEEAWVAAVPFLRVSDLPPEDESVGDALIEGVRATYRAVHAELRARVGREATLVAMGHLYMAGGQLSELSERRILAGNQHALPVDIFPSDVAYVALGHLHRAQRVAGEERVRYSGSPIPLSMAEADYAHQVVAVDLADGRMTDFRRLLVPRRARLVHLEGTLEAVLRAIQDFPALGSVAEHESPFVDVTVTLDGPHPRLRQQVYDALRARAVREVGVHQLGTGHALPLADRRRGQTLRDLTPEQVFVEKHQRVHREPPTAALLAAFHELVAQAHEKTP